MKIALILIGLLQVALHATTVYSDTTTNTGANIVFSTGPYVQIGDQITLASTERTATAASARFFNVGAGSGTFDVTLRFFNVGSPVGSQIGGSFAVIGNSITSGSAATVNWSLGSLVLPTNVVFTIAVSNLAAGLDLGLTLFEPPTIGSSSNQFFIVSPNGSTFSQASQGNSKDNVYFSLTAVATGVPEPGTLLLTLLALPAMALARRRLR